MVIFVRNIRGRSKNSRPLYFETDQVLSFLNIISLCLDALSRTLFKFAYPFKVEAFQVLTNSIYDAFIASEIPTMKVRF